MSTKYKSTRDRKAKETLELVDAFVAQPALATQYVLVLWIGVVVLGLAALMAMVSALMVKEIRGEISLASLELIGIATFAFYFAVSVLRSLTNVYRRYQVAINAPGAAVMTLLGEWTSTPSPGSEHP